MTKKFLIALSLFSLVSGCTIPGTYMGTGDVVGSTGNKIKNELLNANLIPIDTKLLYTGLIAKDSDQYIYHIGPLDVLNVVVWSHPELTMPIGSSVNLYNLDRAVNPLLQTNPQESGIPVNGQGEIFFPYVGKIKVAELTVEQARMKITTGLTKYLRRPQVSVRVAAFNSKRVNIVGEVMQPGVRPITDKPLSILDAINLCGGINVTTADAKHIYVIRDNKKKISVFWLNAKSPQEMILAEKFHLVNNDIVYVAPAGVISWNRVVNQILPTISTVWYTRSLVRD
jgi:polysaccharide biosynthesis/export protein